MPKQIKLTDRVAEELGRRAKEDNLSLAGEVAKLLSVGVGQPAEYRDNFVFGKLEYLEGYLDKKFSKLESLIEDTTVDRLDRGPRKSVQNSPISIEWPVVQELFYEKMKEGDPEWFPGAYKGVTEEMNDDPNCFIKDGVLYINLSGSDIPVLRITPRVDAILAEMIERNA